MRRGAKAEGASPLAALDLQILLVLSDGSLYGYAIKKAVERGSRGVLSPDIGSLYRVLGRLMDLGWIEEADPAAEEPPPHPGRPRRYYGLTPRGREAARAEIRRLREVIDAAGTLAKGEAR